MTLLIEKNFAEISYKKRFAVHLRQGIIFLDIDHTAFFEANESVVYAFDVFGKKYLSSESTLKEIENKLALHIFSELTAANSLANYILKKLNGLIKTR